MQPDAMLLFFICKSEDAVTLGRRCMNTYSRRVLLASWERLRISFVQMKIFIRITEENKQILSNLRNTWAVTYNVLYAYFEFYWPT